MLFIVDFDGTITRSDVIDALLARFASKEYLEIEKKWANNDIGSMECLSTQFELIRASTPDLIQFFDQVIIDKSFIDFCSLASTLGRVAIVSDGMDYAIRHVLKQHQLESIPFFANQLEFTKEGAAIAFPYKSEHCLSQSGCCKCSVSRTLSTLNEPIVLIGDGKSDMCLAERADIVFAKGSLKDFCLKKHIEFTAFNTFADIVTVIKHWNV